MAEVAGKTNLVYAVAGATAMLTSTGAKIAGVDNSTFGKLCDILDITAFGDAYKNRIAGLLDTTISISGNVYVGDATGQDILIPGNTIFIGVYPSGSAVAGTQVKAIVESFEVSSEVAGKQTFSAAFQCIAAPVALPLR